MTSEIEINKDADKGADRLMRIRFLDPNPNFWLAFKKERDYYVKANVNDDSAQYFYLFDIGGFDEPGVQGIAFTRGLPALMKDRVKINQKIDWKLFRIQNVMAEYSSINSSKFEPPEEQIMKFKVKYGKILLKYLQQEISKEINRFSIEKKPGKENEFQLYVDFSESFYNCISILFKSPSRHPPNAEELSMGIEAEKEHINECIMHTEYFTTIIAKNHLDEITDYYSRLQNMESEVPSSNKVVQAESDAEKKSNEAQIIALITKIANEKGLLLKNIPSFNKVPSIILPNGDRLSISQYQRLYAGMYEFIDSYHIDRNSRIYTDHVKWQNLEPVFRSNLDNIIREIEFEKSLTNQSDATIEDYEIYRIGNAYVIQEKQGGKTYFPRPVNGELYKVGEQFRIRVSSNEFTLKINLGGNNFRFFETKKNKRQKFADDIIFSIDEIKTLLTSEYQIPMEILDQYFAKYEYSFAIQRGDEIKRFYQDREYIGVKTHYPLHKLFGREDIKSIEIHKFTGRPYKPQAFDLIVEYSPTLWAGYLEQIRSDAKKFDFDVESNEDFAYMIPKWDNVVQKK